VKLDSSRLLYRNFKLMKRLIAKVTLSILLFSAFISPAVVSAVGDNIENEGSIGICTFIKPICDALGIKDDAATSQTAVIDFTTNRINQVLSLIFIGIIIISVFIIIQAGVKYIQSQGDEGQIAEAQKAIKSVFIGIAVLFVGIIGIILILAFFGGTGLIGTDTELSGDDDAIFRPPT